MEISGNHFFAATPEEVWQIICDPVVLKQSIPQCETMERLNETQWQGTARLKIGPFSTLFSGLITLSNLNPPHSYTISIEARSWLGNSTGSADVRLENSDNGTRLHYDARAVIGISLLDKAAGMASGMAQSIAEKFFNRLADIIAQQRQKDTLAS